MPPFLSGSITSIRSGMCRPDFLWTIFGASRKNWRWSAFLRWCISPTAGTERNIWNLWNEILRVFLRTSSSGQDHIGYLLIPKKMRFMLSISFDYAISKRGMSRASQGYNFFARPCLFSICIVRMRSSRQLICFRLILFPTMHIKRCPFETLWSCSIKT